MKDTVITASMKRREALILLLCFVVANIVNWVSIIKFQTPWYEVFTQLGFVVVLTAVLYGLVLVVRLAWYIFAKLLGRK